MGYTSGYTSDGIGFQKTDTSLNAANSNVKVKSTIRNEVYKFLCKVKTPVSTEQISDAISRPYVSVQPRLSELLNDKLIVDSGERGITQWGKQCILWKSNQ